MTGFQRGYRGNPDQRLGVLTGPDNGLGDSVIGQTHVPKTVDCHASLYRASPVKNHQKQFARLALCSTKLRQKPLGGPPDILILATETFGQDIQTVL